MNRRPYRGCLFFDRFNYDRLKLMITTRRLFIVIYNGFMNMIEQNDYKTLYSYFTKEMKNRFLRKH